MEDGEYSSFYPNAEGAMQFFALYHKASADEAELSAKTLHKPLLPHAPLKADAVAKGEAGNNNSNS